MYKRFLIFFFTAVLTPVYAQSKYWVFFKDKQISDSFSFYEIFSERSIARRLKRNIDWDYRDIPVCRKYIEKVSLYVDSVGYASRWLNAVAIYATESQLDSIVSFPFVKTVEKINESFVISSVKQQQRKSLPIALADYQLKRMGHSLFDQQKLNGKGIIVAVIDAGFKGVNFSDGFSHLMNSGRILKTFDFITKKENVYTGSEHGTMVLSCIAGKNDSVQTGLAPGASFLLARTESEWIENKIEEDRWIAAVEWADLHGASIVNSSLGYTQPRYDQFQLNGESRISKVANSAADKGMLLINAAGNEFNNDWKSIIIPSDAEGSLTVGATDPEDDIQTSFSSVGPTSDGRLKPNVSAPGWAATFNSQGLSTAEGTSFSAPLVAGFAACILQYHQDTLHPTALKKIIENTGHLSPYFDYAHGYGIPQSSSFFYNARPFPSFTMEYIDQHIKINIDTSWYRSQEQFPLFYFHVQSPSGILKNYGVMELTTSSPFVFINEQSETDFNEQKNSIPAFSIGMLNKADIVRFHCNGYTHQFEIP